MNRYKVTVKIDNFFTNAEDKEQAEQAFWDMWHSRDMSYRNETDGLEWHLIVEETD